LIEARSDRHLWAETYERDLREVLALQDEVARDIVGHVQSRIASSARGASTSRHSVGFEAYDAYLKGRYFWNKRTRESLNQAIANFQQAIVIEPDYALAYSGLADTYDVLGSYAAIHPTEAMAKARSAARRALDIDDGLAEAHASLAVVSLDYDWDWPLAEREFRRAIELNPNYAPAHLWYAAYLAALRKPDEAKTEANLAISLDPLSPTVNSHAGWIFYQSRQYDQALLQFRKALELDPAFAPAHMGIGLVSIQWKQYAQAIAELETVRRLSHDSPWALSVLAHAYAASGKRNDARKIADRLRSMSRQEYVPSYRVALIYVALGENDQAFWWLRKAYEERSDSLIYLNTDPELDDIRSDRRFAELVLRVGLPV